VLTQTLCCCASCSIWKPEPQHHAMLVPMLYTYSRVMLTLVPLLYTYSCVMLTLVPLLYTYSCVMLTLVPLLYTYSCVMLTLVPLLYTYVSRHAGASVVHLLTCHAHGAATACSWSQNGREGPLGGLVTRDDEHHTCTCIHIPNSVSGREIT
jgi:hypothetical protein